MNKIYSDNPFSVLFHSQHIHHLLDSNLLISHSHYNQMDYEKINPNVDPDVIKSLVEFICDKAIQINRNVQWTPEHLFNIEYTYSSDEYDRKKVNIDRRLLRLPKEIRSDGHMDYSMWVNYCKQNKPTKKHQTLFSYVETFF